MAQVLRMPCPSNCPSSLVTGTVKKTASPESEHMMATLLSGKQHFRIITAPLMSHDQLLTDDDTGVRGAAAAHVCGCWWAQA